MAKKKKRQYKSNLRRISIVVTAQTDWYLGWLCAIDGMGEKDKGRQVDKLAKAHKMATRVKEDKW